MRILLENLSITIITCFVRLTDQYSCFKMIESVHSAAECIFDFEFMEQKVNQKWSKQTDPSRLVISMQ